MRLDFHTYQQEAELTDRLPRDAKRRHDDAKAFMADLCCGERPLPRGLSGR